jgi:hypothetical protein
MKMPSLELTQHLVLGIHMKLTGGLTQTVFPKTEAKLNDLDYQEALEFVAKRRNMERYHSVMDFLFAESFPMPWKFKCFSYYNGRGTSLINDPDISDSQLAAYDEILCGLVLEICMLLLKAKRSATWQELLGLMHQVIKQAA